MNIETFFVEFKIKIYEVKYDLKDEKDIELISKAESFSELTKDSTYKRSQMNEYEHKKNILIGKLAETAFAELINKLFNVKLVVNYDNNIDTGDFILKGKRLDIKSSSLKTKKYTYELNEALNKLNFTVLKDQSCKDIIVQALYPNRENFYTFYFSKWAFVRDVKNYCKHKTKKIKMNGGYGEYYLMPIKEGKDLEEIINI